MLDAALQNELDDVFGLHWGTEAVTLQRRRVVQGTPVDATIAQALRLEADAPAQPLGDGGLDSTDLAWVLRVQDVGETAPRAGDLVIDGDGVEWTVRRVRLTLFGRRYELACSQGRD